MIIPSVTTAVADAVVAGVRADAAVVGGAAAPAGELLLGLLLSLGLLPRRRPLPGQRRESAGEMTAEGAGGGGAATRPRPRVRGGGGGGAVHPLVRSKAKADGAGNNGSARCAGLK